MNSIVVLFGLSLTVLACLLIWVSLQHIRSLRFWFLAIPFILILSASSYYTINGIVGWPTQVEPHGKQLLHWFIVEEKKSIYLWLEDPKAEHHAPRAHVIPYSRKMHEGLEKIRNDLAKDGPKMMDVRDKKPTKGDGNGEGEDAGDGDSKKNERSSSGIEYSIESEQKIYDFVQQENPPKKK